MSDYYSRLVVENQQIKKENTDLKNELTSTQMTLKITNEREQKLIKENEYLRSELNAVRSELEIVRDALNVVRQKPNLKVHTHTNSTSNQMDSQTEANYVQAPNSILYSSPNFNSPSPPPALSNPVVDPFTNKPVRYETIDNNLNFIKTNTAKLLVFEDNKVLHTIQVQNSESTFVAFKVKTTAPKNFVYNLHLELLPL